MPVIYDRLSEQRKAWGSKIASFILKSAVYGYSLYALVVYTGIIPPPQNPHASYYEIQNAIHSTIDNFGVPRTLKIPTLGIDTSIEAVGVDSYGQMDTPKNPANVGWYRYGSKPFQQGNIILDGHVDTQTDKAIFYDLKALLPGDDIYLNDNLGITHHYQVSSTVTYSLEVFPVKEIFYQNNNTQQLVLITCTGTFSRTKHTYTQRMVVYATQAVS